MTAGGGESQTLFVTASSNNTAVIPHPTVNYISPNAIGSLTYTPVANAFGSAVITVTVDDGGTGTHTVVRTFTVVVNPVADTPSVTNATTNEDTQTTSGLVISRNAADGAEVTHFKITAITNGSLFQNNGTTPIANNDFITFAQGNAGLKFTPSANFFGSGSFTVQASVSGVDAGLGGATATATITVNPVADTPTATNASTTRVRAERGGEQPPRRRTTTMPMAISGAGAKLCLQMVARPVENSPMRIRRVDPDARPSSTRNQPAAVPASPSTVCQGVSGNVCRFSSITAVVADATNAVRRSVRWRPIPAPRRARLATPRSAARPTPTSASCSATSTCHSRREPSFSGLGRSTPFLRPSPKTYCRLTTT